MMPVSSRVWILIVGVLMACSGFASGADDVVRLVGRDMSAWRGNTGDWQVVGAVKMDDTGKKLIVAGSDSTGIFLNGPKGKTANIMSKAEFGDCEAHIEFMIPNGSNSGVYFQGRYEVQIYDSYGVEKDAYPGIECGGIYERWDEAREHKGYEGHSPRVNASKPGGQWQSFDVVFRAPRFDSAGMKLTNARFEKVVHNGVVVHEDIELTGPTRGGAFADEAAVGPLLLQGDHGPVAYRNIRISPAGPVPFFAFDNGMQDENHKTPQSQAKMVAELGYAGIGGRGGPVLRPLLAEMDKLGLRMFSVYVGIDIDKVGTDKPPFGPEMDDAIDALKGRNSILWVYMRSQKLKPSDPAGDAAAVEVLRMLAERAAANKVRIALYPHAGFWVEKVEDSVRLAEKVDRANVGASFNLCHWLRTDDEKNLNKVLAAAMPKLMVVSINGADSGGKDWNTLIQTLDRGSYDVEAMLETLFEMGYNGPVGLQCYGIGGDARDNLARSIEAWKEKTEK